MCVDLSFSFEGVFVFLVILCIDGMGVVMVKVQENADAFQSGDGYL
jgi:hypothetical protein